MTRSGVVTAVLGPTNTGKTHLALERMLGRSSGVIGMPLRLLAREIYDKVVKAKGARAAALVTGEEKIVPPNARYFVCTVEAMPTDRRFAFVGVDEVQLCADPDRGHVFTERVLHMRGVEETMFMGSATMEPILRRLVPEADFTRRERFSQLSYAGAKKLTKLPRRSAVVAFSAEDVYSIAEIIRRQRGGAAVVMGALSPRTRNAQVELYQSGEVDYLVATDAIGMGLNMDVDHVAFAAFSKFDGRRRRRLRADEIGQIAGRAGRFRNDGTFGESADARPLDAEMIEAVENHDFDPVLKLVWRDHQPDLSNMEALRNSLQRPSPHPALERVRGALDEHVLEVLARDGKVRELSRAKGGTARLWDVCRIPDFRKTTLEEHAGLIKTIFGYLMTRDGALPDAWLDAQLKRVSRLTGDVDALSQRLAHVRTWSYAANRPDWLKDAAYWRERTREVEDQLSDALHEQLVARFLDRRTSALVKGLREKADLAAGVDAQGEVVVEGHFVGRIEALSFRADPAAAAGLAARTVRAAAEKAVRPEINRRLGRLAAADDAALRLEDDARLYWEDQPVGRLEPSADAYAPAARLIGGEMGAPDARARAERRLEAFAAALAARELKPLLGLRARVSGSGAPALTGLARGVAYRLIERGGAAGRGELASDLAELSGAERRQLREAGVRIGEHAVFLPALVKPGPARLNALLDSVHRGEAERFAAPPPGRASLPAEPEATALAAAGYLRCGPLAVRLDMLERLAGLIREARAVASESAPKGRFHPSPPMMNLIGAGPEDFRGVLRSLGYKRLKRADDGRIEAELWGRGKREPAPREAPAPPVGDTPFAKLAELSLARADPPRRRSAARKPARRKPRTSRA